MAGLKEIRRRIKSVGNTQKITRAMKLVSAAKLRKAQEAVQLSQDYSDTLLDLLAVIETEAESGEIMHPLLIPHASRKKTVFLVIGGSKGLCGPYNSNLHKFLTAVYKERLASHPESEIEIKVLGSKPVEYCQRMNYPLSDVHQNLPGEVLDWPVHEICAELEESYISAEVDEVFILYTKFKSAMSNFVTMERLLPLHAELEDDGEHAEGAMIFEPSIDEVLEYIVPAILRSRFTQACLNSVASEHGSRMSAMDAATTNASDLLEALKLKRNKLRQGNITAELLDIIGGSEAIS